MEMQAVISSNISMAGFDKVAGIMRVVFHNGGTYEAPATQADFDSFMASKSKGKYFNNVLKQACSWKRIEKQG